MGIYCFYHVCSVPKGIEVFKDQLKLIKNSGLLNKIDKIFIGVLGDYFNFLNLPEYLSEPKLQVVYFSKNVNEMEFPTIINIKNFCDNSKENHKILYIHTKNVRYPNSLNHYQWRKFLEYFNIERHFDCIKDLDTHDVCGVNYKIKPWKHFSGNFWWANSQYIKNLIHPINLPREGTRLGNGGRYNTEKWLLTHININKNNKLEVISGYYGISENDSMDITDKLRSIIKDNRLYIKMTDNINNLFERDPNPMKPKQIFVKYKINDIVKTELVLENRNRLNKDLLIDVCQIKIKCYHQSNLNHYNDPYPRELYEIK